MWLPNRLATRHIAWPPVGAGRRSWEFGRSSGWCGGRDGPPSISTRWVLVKHRPTSTAIRLETQFSSEQVYCLKIRHFSDQDILPQFSELGCRLLARIAVTPDEVRTHGGLAAFRDHEVVDKTLQRLVNAGGFRRIVRGLYNRLSPTDLAGRRTVTNHRHGINSGTTVIADKAYDKNAILDQFSNVGATAVVTSGRSCAEPRLLDSGEYAARSLVDRFFLQIQGDPASCQQT